MSSTDAGHRRGLVASLTATIGANLPVFLTGSLAVQLQDDLVFGDAALGVAVGAFYASGAVSAPYAGRLVARLGAQRSLRNAALTSALALVIVAASARSWGVLVAVLAIGGVANAWAQPASNVFLMDIVPRRRLGLALGVQKSAIPAAALVGGLAVPIARGVGWRWVFLAGGVLALLSALQVPASPRSNESGGASAAPPRRIDGSMDSSRRALMILAVGVGLGSSASNALSAFLVRGGVEAGLHEAFAAVLLTVGSILGMVVRLVLGHRADRRPGRTLAWISWMFVAAAAAFALLATEVGWVFAIATPLAFSTGYAWPGLFHLAVVRSNPSAPAAATGLAMTGTLAGAVGGPVVFGVVADHVSFHAAWLVGAAMLLCAAAVIVAASRHIDELPGAAPVEPQPLGGTR